jgi:hypothetical protein
VLCAAGRPGGVGHAGTGQSTTATVFCKDVKDIVTSLGVSTGKAYFLFFATLA